VYYLNCLYRRLLATISPLGFYVLHYGSQYFNGFKEKENILSNSSVQHGFCCCALALDIYVKYVIHNYLLWNVFPEKEFNHLRGVNKQPYWEHQNLSIAFDQPFLLLFSTAIPGTTLQWSIPLLCLFNCIFYIHPIGHVWVAFCLYLKTSLSGKPFMGLPPTGSLIHCYVKCFA